MAKLNAPYRCVLFEKGDTVVYRHGELFEKTILTIEDTELKQVGIFMIQQLKFVGRPVDITALSNYYEPVGESAEKYKDGLKYYNETKAKVMQEKATKTGSKVHSGFGRRIKQDDTLTEDDLKFKIIKKK